MMAICLGLQRFASQRHTLGRVRGFHALNQGLPPLLPGVITFSPLVRRSSRNPALASDAEWQL